MNLIKIDQIKVPKDRHRKDMGDLEGLADSIDRIGLIQPIVVDRDLDMAGKGEEFTLIAGERRLQAHKLLHATHILAHLFEDLDDMERKEIELEENIRRKQLTWQEECTAKLELHEMKQELHGVAFQKQQEGAGWRVKDTAEAIGESIGNVSMDIQVAQAMRQFPHLASELSKTQAYNKLKRLVDRKVREALVKDEDRPPYLFQQDCRGVVLESNSIDLIITDPPFGVDLDKAYDFKKKYEEVYAQRDDFKGWMALLRDALPGMYRVLKDGGHMYIFFASKRYPLLPPILTSVGFHFDPIPCIWCKGESAGSLYKPFERFRPNYEPFFFCWKGDKPNPLQKHRGMVFNYPAMAGQTKEHPAEKPKELGNELCELSSVKGEVVLDPFAGVGSLLKPAFELDRKVIGIEIDPKYYNIMVGRLK